MGLDMYLEKYPRNDLGIDHKGVASIEEYLSWKEKCDNGVMDCTFEEWCGRSESEVDMKGVEFYKKYFTTKYYAWDTEHRYPHKRLSESLVDWRKANAIHRWFVENVQDGEDDCGSYAVDEEQLEELRDLCKEVIEGSVMTPGKVKIGTQYSSEGVKELYEDGMNVVNTDFCEEKLPAQEGFFFGSTTYDSYYMDVIQDTFKTLNQVLEETDFEKEYIVYSSSW